jgi:hypothetical protein
MPTSPHRIRRQRWVVRACSGESAFSIRKRLRDDWQALLLPAFEEAFDQAAGGEDVVRISKIELGFKVAFEEELTGSLPELIRHQLAEQLREIFRGRPQTNRKPAAWYRLAQQQTRFEILLHYLRTGSVTWEAASHTASELANELKKVCRERRQELQDVLRNEQLSTTFYFRLFQLIPASDAGGLAEAILERIPHPWKAPLLEVLVLLLESGEKHFGRYFQLELAALFLTESRAAQKSETAPDLTPIAESILPAQSNKALAHFVFSLPASALALFRTANRSRAGPYPGPALGGRLDASVTTAPSANSASPLANSISPPDEERESIRSRFESLSAIAGASQTREFAALWPQAANDLRPRDANEFPLMVTHAGLILLHPFLPRFFECTGVKEEAGARLSPFLSTRAAALLHFLATGREEIYEYDLAFIKVLLGLYPDRPLCVSEGIVADSDKQEAESLLQSAITHWAALRNTSIAGFRSSFLNRQALLREDENGWKLQVERLAFDVLLDKLPWSISVVKLPWMTRPIYTEW